MRRRTRTIEHDKTLFGDAPAARNAVAELKPAKKNEVAKVERIPTSSDNIFAIMTKAGPEKARLYLDMYNEVRAEEARMAFTEAKIALQRVTPKINKDGKIEIEPKPGARSQRKQSTPYASFENIMTVMQPILIANGFDLWFSPDVGENNRLILRGHLDHVKGHSKTCSIPMPLENSGSKNDAQGVGSSITYAKRYATIALLNIVSYAQQDRDMDGGKVVEEKATVLISKLQLAELTEAIKDCGVGADTFCNKYEIERVDDLPTNLFDDAMKACANFKAHEKARQHG